jgi:DNA-binding NtrC family response regulator
LEATRIGAADFLEKPIALQKLLKTVANVMQQGLKKERQHIELIEQIERRVIKQYTLPLDLSLREAREHFDKLYFNHHMNKENGNVTRVAENMGIERTHLYRKLKQLGIKMLKKNSDNN